eukprot:412897-Rhodomonas_salina.1
MEAARSERANASLEKELPVPPMSAKSRNQIEKDEDGDQRDQPEDGDSEEIAGHIRELARLVEERGRMRWRYEAARGSRME